MKSLVYRMLIEVRIDGNKILVRWGQQYRLPLPSCIKVYISVVYNVKPNCREYLVNQFCWWKKDSLVLAVFILISVSKYHCIVLYSTSSGTIVSMFMETVNLE